MPTNQPVGSGGPTDLAGVELLRQGVNDALTFGTMSNASLDDWEQTIQRYGRATRDRPAAVLLDDLATDLGELQQVLGRYRSASSLRRLTRVTAHMSGLMCLTLVKLDDRRAFRRWAHTARLAASEAGDPFTLSWVLAHEAYGHYYSHDLREALDVARCAQEVVKQRPGVGAALAAALEARIHAAMGRKADTHAALRRAEQCLANLPPAALAPSAFGYNEAQLRFHESNALTHLGDTAAARRSQDSALQLIPPADFMDRAFTELDRAMCFAIDGDATQAAMHAANTLNKLSIDQRQGIISLRASDILRTLPAQERRAPAARDLRELLDVSQPKGDAR
jgi:tetratricopeptide (TPR) repeat protein